MTFDSDFKVNSVFKDPITRWLFLLHLATN